MAGAPLRSRFTERTMARSSNVPESTGSWAHGAVGECVTYADGRCAVSSRVLKQWSPELLGDVGSRRVLQIGFGTDTHSRRRQQWHDITVKRLKRRDQCLPRNPPLRTSR